MTFTPVEFLAPRTGDKTIKGKGRLLAEIINEPQSNGKKSDIFNRWFNLRLWETVGGKYVLSIAFRTNFIDKEVDHDFAGVFTTLPEALKFAEEVYDPEKRFYIPTLSPKHMYAAKIHGDRKKFIDRYKADCQRFIAMASQAAGIGEQTTEID